MTLKLVTNNFVPTKKSVNVSDDIIEEISDAINCEMQYNDEYLESQDAIDNAIECITCDGLDNIYIDSIECYDDRALVQYLLDNNQDAIFDMCSSELTEGYHKVENELTSLNIGESEHVLSDELTERILELSNHDIKEIFSQTDFYFNVDYIIQDKTSEYPSIYGYICRDYDRYSLILDLDLLHEFFSNNLEVA